ncbi:hypothetical protein CDAR_435801 [Caerostris darwini]|uniref:Uncharacterized protein n=1 Tax=Caerostris darwini TaxID=1538125 RepID=A0AAV4PJY0_9ARAC|nr:hypothetical protein CDAR_435801 [Caerostris darwini]
MISKQGFSGLISQPYLANIITELPQGSLTLFTYPLNKGISSLISHPYLANIMIKLCPESPSSIPSLTSKQGLFVLISHPYRANIISSEQGQHSSTLSLTSK